MSKLANTYRALGFSATREGAAGFVYPECAECRGVGEHAPTCRHHQSYALIADAVAAHYAGRRRGEQISENNSSIG